MLVPYLSLIKSESKFYQYIYIDNLKSYNSKHFKNRDCFYMLNQNIFLKLLKSYYSNPKQKFHQNLFFNLPFFFAAKFPIQQINIS